MTADGKQALPKITSATHLEPNPTGRIVLSSLLGNPKDACVPFGSFSAHLRTHEARSEFAEKESSVDRLWHTVMNIWLK